VRDKESVDLFNVLLKVITRKKNSVLKGLKWFLLTNAIKVGLFLH